MGRAGLGHAPQHPAAITRQATERRAARHRGSFGPCRASQEGGRNSMSTTPAVIRTCDGCGPRTRIPASPLADTGRCGKCQAALPPAAEPIDADAALFDAVVAAAKVPVLVDFWAPW